MSADYVLKKLETRAEMDGIVSVQWHARYDRHYLPFITWLFPVIGYTVESDAASLVAAQDRYWAEHERRKAQGTAHTKQWVFVRHIPTDEIVGCACFDLAEGSPFPSGKPELDPYWFPEGDAKDFLREMIAQQNTPRSIWMQRPHGGLRGMAVLSEHRGRGVGSMLMKFGNDQLDEKGVEGFIEATEMGRYLYAKWGYITVMKVCHYLPIEKEKQWARWAHELMLDPAYCMWRPPYGVVKDGERDRPWQLGPSLPVK